MVRLSWFVPFLLALCLLVVGAPAALAQGTTPTITFGHDDTLDDPNDLTGSENDQEIHSGVFSALPYDANAQPDEQREQTRAAANALGGIDEDNPTWEKFPFDIPAGDENGSFTVTVTWQEAAIDLDVYVYRQRPNGTLDPSPVAQSASVADPERATRFEPIAGDPIRTGRYWVYVDNWCSNDFDPIVVRFLEGSCTGDATAPLSNVDEDDFVGQVTFTPFSRDNKLPTAGISGPDSGLTGQGLAFSGSGSDSDGTIENYSFDLDGDGRFEYDNGKSAGPATARFEQPGTYSVGVRVADDRGGTAYASKKVTISGPPVIVTSKSLGLLSSFKLNRPVFGGRKGAKLVVRYRLREPGRAIVSLYRGTKRVKRLSSGNRRANRTYRINISPGKLRKGATYTVRLSVRSADGKRRQSARLSAQRL